MIQRKFNLNLCLALAVGAILISLILGALQKQYGILDGADAAAIEAAKTARLFYPLTFVMYIVSLLGDEMGLTIVICIIYWLGHTTEALSLLLMLLFGNALTSHMKEFFALSRPLTREISPLYNSGGYGYPSGHSMVGMLYSWLFYSFIKRYWYICLSAAFLMAASRIYLGVHYFSDTIGGLLCGFGVVAAGMGIYSHVSGLDSLRERIRNSLAPKIALPLALSAIYFSIARGLEGASNYAGLLAGVFMVYSMLAFRWRMRNPFFAVVGIIIGLVILVGVRVGLKTILPDGDASDYFRYFVMGVMLAGSPLVFVKIGLAKKLEAEAQES
jgi:membrane-associated phospholipid phosphatase